ncbi:putative photosynthetic complex assembly protein [Rhodovulum iodosum]|uniref:Photosynthetic complex assembly protein n=1 Tax=Rhodovulum iodosum TaxID=68291 RepID=A0ABV3XQP2_9RHOB|nr:photosynthetic complex assembly protein PuhC [Rhodovulum robiginosum]RSK32937.1 pullulanase [Rhodovulum robiginosum]
MKDPKKPVRGHHHDDEEMIPPVLLKAVFALVLCSLLIVAYARITDRPLSANPDDSVGIDKERPIVLQGSMSGSATVLTPEGEIIAEYAEDEGGFVAGVWRVLQRERKKHGAPLDAPIRLVRFKDGRLSLRDDATGWRAELIGFGADNAAVFARLLDDVEG